MSVILQAWDFQHHRQLPHPHQFLHNLSLLLTLHRYQTVSVFGSMMVMDDARLEITGKAIFIGVYMSDIAIPSEPFIAGHLTFFFTVEGSLTERPNAITLEITLPGKNPQQWQMPLDSLKQPAPPDRKRFIIRQSCMLPMIELRTGKITGRVFSEMWDIPVDGPWITLVQPPNLVTTVSPPPS